MLLLSKILEVFFYVFKDVIYLFREHVHVGVSRGRGRGRGRRESPADSVLCMEPDVGLDRTTLRSQPELRPRVGW